MAAAVTVEEIENQTNSQPNDEAQPCGARLLLHEIAASQYSQDGDPGNKRRAKRAWAGGIGSPQDEDASSNEDEGKQRSNVAEVCDFIDVGELRQHSNDNTC